MSVYPDHAMAIVGTAGRFPGAGDVDTFWHNIIDGRDTLTRFDRDELLAAGVDAARLDEGRYVGARGVLEHVEDFDAAFFGMPPREAAITDPQQRVFLETAWEALEDAGHPPTGDDLIGVYAAAGPTTYLTNNVIALRGSGGVNGLEALIGNDKDYVATRVAYKLDLRGPAMAVQTACSSSLVAVCLAAQALDAYDCDTAIAGGVNIRVPQTSGYLTSTGDIMSPEGTCRPFDARADGTVLGNATGAVVLRRLDDAIADGDRILAVLTGWATTNDGARKVGFTAPGPDGQRRAVMLAHARAGVTGADIGYVETHGTGTALGDEIELTALAEAFGGASGCELGAVKATIGHTDVAAGVSGLIKTVLAVHHGVVPPLAHFSGPTPGSPVAQGIFRVPTGAHPWAGTRRAGVSSFGIGGTNAHVVVEQAPEPAPRDGIDRPAELLVLSARSAGALREQTRRLADALGEDSVPLADVAYTLAVGRAAGPYRWSAACHSAQDARSRLAEPPAPARTGGTGFLFPGGGAQYPGMATELYKYQPAFRAAFDACADAATDRLGIDIRTPALATTPAPEGLEDGTVGLPALFATEYALAATFLDWGVQPTVLCGHSLGEYTAAAVAGVFDLADAVELVGVRGRLLDKAAPGAMLSVRLAPEALTPLLPTGVGIAVHEGPSSCVVSGPAPDVAVLERRLEDIGVEPRRVPIAVAAHSVLVEPVLPDFEAAVAAVAKHPPTVPIVSNRTGALLTAAEATSDDYWVRHLRDTVRFADGLATLTGLGPATLVELGPGHTLTRLVKALPGDTLDAVATLPAGTEPHRPLLGTLEALGAVWRGGDQPDWAALYRDRPLRRTALPTYPWQRSRYWIDVTGQQTGTTGTAAMSVPTAGETSGADAPATGVRAQVAAAWFTALGAPAGPDSDFFEMGGQSLAGLRLVNRLSAQFGVPLTLRTLFDNPTVARLSDVITALAPHDKEQA